MFIPLIVAANVYLFQYYEVLPGGHSNIQVSPLTKEECEAVKQRWWDKIYDKVQRKQNAIVDCIELSPPTNPFVKESDV